MRVDGPGAWRIWKLSTNRAETICMAARYPPAAATARAGRPPGGVRHARRAAYLGAGEGRFPHRQPDGTAVRPRITHQPGSSSTSGARAGPTWARRGGCCAGLRPPVRKASHCRLRGGVRRRAGDRTCGRSALTAAFEHQVGDRVDERRRAGRCQGRRRRSGGRCRWPSPSEGVIEEAAVPPSSGRSRAYAGHGRLVARHTAVQRDVGRTAPRHPAEERGASGDRRRTSVKAWCLRCTATHWRGRMPVVIHVEDAEHRARRPAHNRQRSVRQRPVQVDRRARGWRPRATTTARRCTRDGRERSTVGTLRPTYRSVGDFGGQLPLRLRSDAPV